MEDGPKEHVHIAEGQDDGVHMLSSSDPRAVTCRYDMKKLRQLGALEEEVLDWLAAKVGKESDELDVEFNVEDALEKSEEGRRAYLTDICKELELENAITEVCDIYLPKLKDLEDYNKA